MNRDEIVKALTECCTPETYKRIKELFDEGTIPLEEWLRTVAEDKIGNDGSSPFFKIREGKMTEPTISKDVLDNDTDMDEKTAELTERFRKLFFWSDEEIESAARREAAESQCQLTDIELSSCQSASELETFTKDEEEIKGQKKNGGAE